MRRTIAVIIVALVLVACTSTSETDELESKANKIMERVYGPCFAEIYDGDLAEASVVRTSTETDGVVTVSVFLTRIATGEDVEYEFRVNTGLGDYTGIPNPGAAIPTNDPASELVAICDA